MGDAAPPPRWRIVGAREIEPGMRIAVNRDLAAPLSLDAAAALPWLAENPPLRTVRTVLPTRSGVHITTAERDQWGLYPKLRYVVAAEAEEEP